MTAPFPLIAQISDLHIKRPGEKAYGVVDTEAALTRCVAHLNQLQPRPDLVVISGDLVDGGTDEEYAHFAALIAPLEIPFLAIPGNHDSRAPMRRALGRQPYAQDHGAMNIAAQIRDLDLFLVDSSVPGKPHGHLDEETLAWLERNLADGAQRPAIIFLHHPPFVAGIRHMDVQNLRNADALAAIVARHPRVQLVAAGHVHRDVSTLFAGVRATICPAPNHAVTLDLIEALPPSFTVEPPAFHLHALLPSATGPQLVTHFVPIGDFVGPHPFFDAEGQLL
jgi:3',5'-cyclic AMP phosphodiesterase CpdA